MPSRRELLLTFGAGLGAGVGGGYVAGARPFAEPPDSPPTPLAATPTEWPFRDYDRGRTRNPPPESAPTDSPEEQWRHTSERNNQDRPVVGNGEVVLPVRPEHQQVLELRSLDLASGTRTWTWDTRTTDPSSTYPEVAAVGNSVFLVARLPDENNARISLTATRGDEQWRHLGREGGGPPTPITAEGYLVTRRPIDDGVEALDSRTGEIAWQWGDGDLSARPVYDGERIVVNTEEQLVGLDPHTGDQRWQSTHVSGDTWGPVVAGERIFAGYENGKLGGFDAATGERLWEKHPDGTGTIDCEDGRCSRAFGTGSVSDDALVAVEERTDSAPDVLHVREPADGSLRWRAEPAPDGDAWFTDPVICDGTVYVGEFGETDASGGVAGFDLASGERTFSLSVDGNVVRLVLTGGWMLAQTPKALVAFQ